MKRGFRPDNSVNVLNPSVKGLTGWAAGILCLLIFGSAPSVCGEGTRQPAGFIGYAPGLYEASNEEMNAAWSESFEMDGISWRPLYQEPDVKVTFHRRTETAPHSGRSSEEVKLDFPNSGFAFLGHYVDYPIVFNETSPSVWIRSDRPGITVGVLVILPETIRSDSKTPLSLLLIGSTYRRTGEWEELVFEKDLKQLLDETVRAIRAEHQIKVDPNNAYIRQLVLFTEQGKGPLRLWIDDLRIEGHATQSLSILEEKEQNALFDPINLLAFRFLATNSSVVMESSADKIRQWPTEPFALGSDKMMKIKKLKAKREFASSNGLKRSVYAQGVGNKTETAAPFDLSAPSEKERIETVDFWDDSSAVYRKIATAEYADAPLSLSDPSSTVIIGSGTMPATAEYPDSFPTETGVSFPEVRFSERMLFIDGPTPVAIRAVEYQGEPLSFLKGLRFNAVWLKSAPTRELLEEARRTDIWLIAPPPIGNETVGGAAASNAQAGNALYFNGAAVSDDYNKVLMWDLGSGLTESQYQTVAERSNSVKILDPHRRPIVANVRTGLRLYSDRGLDLLVLKRRPLLTSFDMADYALWLRQYPNLMLVGFPFWNEIQTQPDEQLLAQCRFFGAVDEMPTLISYEQIRQQVRLSLAANAHGLLFASSSPLNAGDHETQYRACALELINLELLLIDAWFAGGTPEEVIGLNNDQIAAMILRTKSTSLLLPVSNEKDSQMVFGQGAANSQSFVVPAKDGYSADLLLPGKLRKVPSRRRAGGIDLSLDEISMNSLVFLAQSNWYTRVVAEKSPKLGDRMAELAVRLAKMRVDTYKETLAALAHLEDQGQIPRIGRQSLLSVPEQQTALEQTCDALDVAENYLRQGDPSEAYLQAERALREIRMNERRLWKIGTRFDQCLPVLPVSVSFSVLPAYIESYDKIASGRVKLSGQNRLIGGDMEKTEDWTGGKWNRVDVPYPGVGISLRSEPVAARQGNLGLCFNVTVDGEGGPVQMEVSPLMVEVPVQVTTGELICVQGWIKIDRPIRSETDGFMIYENQGGEALAQRYYKTDGWKRFAFYRYAAYDGEMKLTFALSNYGQVYLDDVSVQSVE